MCVRFGAFGARRRWTQSGRRAMNVTPTRRDVLALGVGLSLSGVSLAQTAPNVREVKIQANVQDFGRYNNPEEDKLWVLDFRFKDPRLITADVPGRGKKVCWYLWYQVINNTRKPRLFFPVFELVTTDKLSRHRDQFLPSVQEDIRRIEDPQNFYKIKNSSSISAELIPPTPPDAVPKAVTGVAIWDDVDPDANYYSIFVAGLSNGYTVSDPIPPDTEEVIRRKTLQLNFRRLGDRYEMKSSEIQFQAPAMWVYRGTAMKIPGLLKKPAAPAAPPPGNN
jgi:hypothetical protein